MTETNTCGEARGSALAPQATNDAAERNNQPIGRSTLLCAPQAQIEFGFNDRGDALLTQKSWPDDDVTIVVARENIGEFIDRLTDALGVPSVGGCR
jgi:hypothetical protein